MPIWPLPYTKLVREDQAKKEKEMKMAEKHQNYMNGTNGPFKCSNCEYYVAANSCDNTHIVTLAEDGKFGLRLNKSGNYAVVDPEGCSDYFEPKSLLDEPIDDSEENE